MQSFSKINALDQHPKHKIFIETETDNNELNSKAKYVSEKYDIPMVDHTKKAKVNAEFILRVNRSGLILLDNRTPSLGKLELDFLSGKFAYRLKHLKDQKQLLLKALGNNLKKDVEILDLTAGFGRDGFILSQLGFSITLVERVPIIAALLEDCLHRAFAVPRYSNSKIKLVFSDAFFYLKQRQQEMNLPQIIFLDPMFPDTKKTALVKKEMSFLRALVGQNADAADLLKFAVTLPARTIVKRTQHAPCLANLKPQYCIHGKKQRFDIYINPK